MVSKPGTLSGLTDEEKEQWLELISSNPYSRKKSKSSQVMYFFSSYSLEAQKRNLCN